MTGDHSPIASPYAGEENPESPRFSGLNLVWIGSVPLLVFMFLLWRHRFGLVDDAYIPMVYARNLVRGLGIVFRPGGGPVEGFTSPLWTAGLTLGEILCIPLPTLAWLGSVSAGMGLLFLTAKIVPLLYPTLSRKESHIGAGFAALLLASDFTYVGWSASGLETSAYALGQMVLLYSLLKPASPRTVALTLLILALLRPEGICLLLPGLAIIRWQGRSLRPAGMAIFFWLALPYAAFLVWRYTYFGYWLPNTFYAKHGFGGWPLLWRGAFYAYTFFVPRPVFILLGFIFLTKDWKKSNSVPLMLFALANLVIVILEGGDHFAMHRFLLPLLPFLALLTTRGVLGMMAQAFASRPALTPSQRTAILAGFCLILTIGQHSRIAIYKNDDHYIFSKGVQWLANESAWAESWKRYGLWLKEKYPPGTLIAVTTAGAVCYFSDLPSLDILGLNDTTVAHTPNPSPDWRYPGHDKSNPDYILSQKPRFIQLFPLLFFSSHPYPEWRLEQMITYPAQRDLWQHPQFQDEYHLRTEETRHGFISYYERKTNP